MDNLFDGDYLEQFDEIIDDSQVKISNIKPSEWAEQNRIMSTDVSPVKGKFKFKNSPYTREIIDCLAPDHPARRVAVIKAAQIGLSVGLIENGIGWIIDQHPGNILYLCGHSDLIKPTVKKIDTMIDACGLRAQIKSTTKRVRNTKSGDTDTMKEFKDGYLKIGTTNHKSLRNISMMYGFIDDFEAMVSDTKEAGATTSMIEQRFAAYGKVMKLFYISSPEQKEGSNIEGVYELGDQRKFFIPCPHCGEFIELKWFGEGVGMDMRGGMRWDLDEAGDLIGESVRYCCQKCEGEFDESEKHIWTNEGKWIPTAKPSRPDYYSYHISALVAPPFMFGWEQYVRQYLEACPPDQPRDERKFQSFVNLALGETYAGKTESIDPNKLQRNIREYEVGVVPEDLSMQDGNGKIIMLTCGVDLNGKTEDARIDYEIIAHSESGATYSITHGSCGTFQRFNRDNTDRQRFSYKIGAMNSVWPLLDSVLRRVFPLDNGSRRMTIALTGIDSGYQTDYAYQFSEATSAPTVCIKGDDDAKKFVSPNANLKTYKHSRERPGRLYLSENQYTKDQLARYMQLSWSRNSKAGQPEGFMNFPTPEGGCYLLKGYFEHFAAEEKVMDTDGRMRWKKKSQQHENHLFDCRLYAIVSKDIAVDRFCKEKGIKNPSWPAFIDYIKSFEGDDVKE
jgi:phage terminase large subunit GpA-like protein